MTEDKPVRCWSNADLPADALVTYPIYDINEDAYWLCRIVDGQKIGVLLPRSCTAGMNELLKSPARSSATTKPGG